MAQRASRTSWLDKPADFTAFPELYGCCIYAFMCHHSLCGSLSRHFGPLATALSVPRLPCHANHLATSFASSCSWTHRRMLHCPVQCSGRFPRASDRPSLLRFATSAPSRSCFSSITRCDSRSRTFRIHPGRYRKCRKPSPPPTHTHTPTHNLMGILFAGLRRVLRRRVCAVLSDSKRDCFCFAAPLPITKPPTSDIGVVQAILVAYLALGFSALAAFGGLADDKDGWTWSGPRAPAPPPHTSLPPPPPPPPLPPSLFWCRTGHDTV